jgi:hypothetical protein
MEIIYNPDPSGGSYEHSYTFQTSTSKGVGELYYEISFFDADGAFIGMSNGFADLTLKADRCNGMVFLPAIAKSYEVSWRIPSNPKMNPDAEDLAQITIDGFDVVIDDSFGNSFFHEFTFKASGPKELGDRYYEIVFWDQDGEFLGFSNGFADLSRSPVRCNGMSFFTGRISSYEFCWR